MVEHSWFLDSSILLRLSSRAFLLTSLSLTQYCSCRFLATFFSLALGYFFLIHFFSSISFHVLSVNLLV